MTKKGAINISHFYAQECPVVLLTISNNEAIIRKKNTDDHTIAK